MEKSKQIFLTNKTSAGLDMSIKTWLEEIKTVYTEKIWLENRDKSMLLVCAGQFELPE